MSVAKTAAVRVLLVEDEPADEEFAKRALSTGAYANFELYYARQLSEALDCLQSDRFDVLLLDLGLPGCCGLEALQEIRAHNCDVPIVVLTGLSDEQRAVEAIEQGAQDYLVKGHLSSDSLPRSIRYAIQRQQLLAATIERELAAESRANLATIVECSDDAIISDTSEGVIVSWNLGAERMYGYPAAEALGRTISFLVPPARAAELEEIKAAILRGEPFRRFETQRVCKDGRLIDVSLSVSPIKDKQGTTIGISRIARDISDRKRAEEALEERARLATVTASVGLILARREDLPSTLRECAEVLVKDLDGAFARIWTLNPQDNVLELQASAGMYTHLDGPHSRVPVGQFKIGLIAAERKPHLTNDVIGDPRVGDQVWAKSEGMVAFAGYPLIVDDRLVGVMAMFARHQLKPATLDAMAAVGDQIAAGIERKRAEKSLQFTQFTIDHVATPVFWSDADGRFFNVNEAACRLSGYSREELLSLCVSDVNPSIPHTVWPTVWSELRRRGTLALESNLQRKDGTEIPISVDCNLLQANGREFSCSFLQDISERKEAEQAQRQSELRFRAIYNQLQLQIERMPLAYILFDADCRVIDWNPAAERIFGYRKGEVPDLKFLTEKMIPDAFRSTAEEILRRVQMGDMSAHSINDNLTKDGRTITCEWMNTPLQSEDGQFSGLMCLAQDVTERKRLEEQFRQAQKMEAVGALAGGIAHEFNNLLQTICGYTKFAIDTLPPGEQRSQDLQLVLKSADRATVLTRQLLSFGRRQVLHRTHVDPNQVVAELTTMLRPLIGEDIEIQTHLAPVVAALYADPGQLQQVLLNLCINARDAMPGGGRLIIRSQNTSLNEGFCASHPGAKPGQHVLLSVADTGCGMSSDVKARIFEPFFTTKELGKGTGLGLAMVYGMVEQHGGIIHVYSEPGAGTTFKIYLPVEGSSEPRASQPISLKPAGGSETILIAEDDPMVRGFLVRVLAGAGYQTLAAADGADGLRAFMENAETISLAVLDVVMPHMGGRALFQRLRTINPDIRVIFCTGHDPEVNRPETIEQGLPMLQKPVGPDSLLQAVRTVLDAQENDWHAAGQRVHDGNSGEETDMVLGLSCGPRK